jgi:putative methionine-R-sulfoxide reductase with GAF domain
LQFAQIPHNVATIDVESEEPHAFSKDIQDLLQACSDVIRPLWEL